MNDDHSGRFTRMPILYDDRSVRYGDGDAVFLWGGRSFAGAGPLVHGLGGP